MHLKVAYKYRLTLCNLIKNDVIDSIRLQNFFSPQIFTAVKNAISHLKGHKIYFLEEKSCLHGS